MAQILVIDDSLMKREHLKEILDAYGSSVLLASDGMDTLEQIWVNQPDIISLDIVMLRMNGDEVCREIKTNLEIQTVPAVRCPIKAEDFDCCRGTKQGADTSLTKPYRANERLNLMKTLLNTD